MPANEAATGQSQGQNSTRPVFPCNACVAQPVSKKDIAKNPKAMEAMRKEWDRLRVKKVWDESTPMEWDDVRRQADAEGVDVHMGYCEPSTLPTNTSNSHHT